MARRAAIARGGGRRRPVAPSDGAPRAAACAHACGRAPRRRAAAAAARARVHGCSGWPSLRAAAPRSRSARCAGFADERQVPRAVGEWLCASVNALAHGRPRLSPGAAAPTRPVRKIFAVKPYLLGHRAVPHGRAGTPDGQNCPPRLKFPRLAAPDLGAAAARRRVTPAAAHAALPHTTSSAAPAGARAERERAAAAAPRTASRVPLAAPLAAPRPRRRRRRAAAAGAHTRTRTRAPARRVARRSTPPPPRASQRDELYGDEQHELGRVEHVGRALRPSSGRPRGVRRRRDQLGDIHLGERRRAQCARTTSPSADAPPSSARARRRADATATLRQRAGAARRAKAPTADRRSRVGRWSVPTICAARWPSSCDGRAEGGRCSSGYSQRTWRPSRPAPR